ncbi:MAG: hypothetical protein ABSG68_12425 [Thermoguttaceae bacterium]|jgi:ABC-type transport system involved in multi-copper enzyme maturation permease subunit
MPIESNDVMPLLDWLLGPGWYGAWLWQPLVLAIAIFVFGGPLVWGLMKVCKGSDRAAQVLGRLLAWGVLLPAIIVGLVAGVRALIAVLANLGVAHVQAILSRADALLSFLLRVSQVVLGVGWFVGALYYWVLVIGLGILVFLAVGFFVATLRSGPRYALRAVDEALAALVADLGRLSPRRVWALAALAMKESIRRKVVVVFIVFVLILLFAGWFLDPRNVNPARLYLGFVLTATSYLVWALALFISSLSLPADVKSRTLHTVVTKPVRKSEIVLGRILGFSLVGTVLLAGMGLISYVFVIRGLSHTHPLAAGDLRAVGGASGSQTPALKGLTGKAREHRHEVYIDPFGKTRVEMQQGHWHELTISGSGDQAVYTLGPPVGDLVARVPMYGKLRFKDRKGGDAERGVNVGDEWTYRSFIDGGTNACAIWNFQGIRAAMFPDGIPVELTIEVFRTHKGDMTKGVLGSLWVRNPETARKVEVRNFLAKKFATDTQFIPRLLEDENGEKVDLFRDIVTPDGQVEIMLYCLEGGQYFGAAQADVYFRARDGSFWLNFVKGYAGIWLQMVLVIALGTLLSTFLSGPVAFVATLGALCGGLFVSFMNELAVGKVLGGGPFESMIRLATQQNQVTDLEPGLKTTVAQMTDKVVGVIMGAMAAVLPPFGDFSYADHVAYGFDVGGDLLMRSIFRAAAYLVPLFVAGYLFLKTREVGR